MPSSHDRGEKKPWNMENLAHCLNCPPPESANVLHQWLDDRKQIHTSAIRFVGFPHRSRVLPKFTALPGLAVKLDSGSFFASAWRTRREKMFLFDYYYFIAETCPQGKRGSSFELQPTQGPFSEDINGWLLSCLVMRSWIWMGWLA